MYAALWRVLPGPWPVRLLIVLALVAAAAAFLILVGYPWAMQTFFPTPDPVLGAAAAVAPDPTTASMLTTAPVPTTAFSATNQGIA